MSLSRMLMRNQNRQKKIFDLLSEDGFRPTWDGSEVSDIAVKVEAGTYFITVDATDPGYYQILYPNFWIVDDKEHIRNITVANDVANRTSKFAKCFSVDNSAWCAVQVLEDSPVAFYKNFLRYVSAIQFCVKEFNKVMLAFPS